MFAIPFVFLLVCCIFMLLVSVHGEISSGRIKGDDEPHMVSWRVLEGVTEPFESNQQESIPAWKQMKNAADQKAAGLAIQQALHEYGQLLRHPYMFGEMPTEERYDVFLSMAKLLKTMGFHQRAELLLYEAMSYTTNPHEAHLQLGLLFLDKEDLEKAKIHLKNCLFFKENDVLVLIHLSVILIAEGKVHEAKFFLTHILTGLEARVHTLAFVMKEADIQALTTERVDYKVLSVWVEDLIVKVFYGEFRFTPSSTLDMLKLFSNLYRSLSEGELAGRFIFDLGQSLYEGGRPKIGQMMMRRGFETSDAEAEGEVSTSIVDLRLALDYPVVPDSLLEVLQAYLNMTSFLSNTSASYTAIDLENVVDLYWPVPLLAWSALPMMPVLSELMWRFEGGPVRTDPLSVYWLLELSADQVIELYHPGKEVLDSTMYVHEGGSSSSSQQQPQQGTLLDETAFSFDKIKDLSHKAQEGQLTVVIPPTTGSVTGERVKVEVGILGGHMNNHPVGQMLYQRLLGLSAALSGSSTNWRDLISLTLLALPLVPDTTTKRIAGSVQRIVNLPMDTAQAWRLIQSLHLDILVFPDWQPFPDQQSSLFQSRRIAPVQVCLFVRGSSCASVAIDYYLMPAEMEAVYLQGTPACDIDAKVSINTTVRGTTQSTHTPSSSSTAVDQKQGVPPEGSTAPFPAAANTQRAQPVVRVVQKPLRPQWKEFFSEQVVVLDWPVLTPRVVQSISAIAAADENTATNRRTKSSERKSGGGLISMPDDASAALMFSPLEIEGRIFFENQPVAVLPVYPTYVSPLFDELLFKIMRSAPSLHVVLALPESFFTHTRDTKHKIAWARKLVRRLWTRGGGLFHRIRLLPSPLSDHRLLQLLRQADMVLDTFPIGSSFYFLALALSVGTPVIALRTGTHMHSSKEDLKEMRTFLAQVRQKQRQNNVTFVNPLAQHVAQSDLPFSPSLSAVSGFYRSIGLERHFIANSTAEYFQLAVNLITNRENAYSLRVRLLEAIDGHSQTPRRRSSASPSSPVDRKPPSQSPLSATMEDWEEEEEGQKQEPPSAESSDHVSAAAESLSALDCGHCVDDLGRFFLNVGVPYARSRTWRVQSLKQRTGTATQRPPQHTGSTAGFGASHSEFHGAGSIS